MKANPGGQIAPSEIIGRDDLIQRLWQILERQSLILSAERRIGKTSVIKKMIAEAPQDKLPIYRDLEQVHTLLEFGELVFEDVERYLSGLRRTAERTRRFISQLSGGEFTGIFKLPTVIAPHWKTLLTKIIEDLVEHQDRMVIFFWDELPMMLDNIRKREGDELVMEVLNTLRALRQTHPDLRMVFTGSIGLHHVIASIKQAGYSNAPTNDMYQEEVLPLSPGYAQELARLLLEGESIQADDVQGTTFAIANGVDCVPFYVHHIIDQMKQRKDATSPDAAMKIIDSFLTDQLDRWDLQHYRSRIETYYGSSECTLALDLLDILSAAETPLLFDELFNLLKTHVVTDDEETARRVLVLLQRDHYVARQVDGAYSFRLQLIRRWWRLDRGV
jgi:hypothetical protein